MLDHDGHGSSGSWQWLERLASVDDLVATLAETLPADTCLLVTGDHGMVNIPLESRIVAEETPALGGYDVLGGEPPVPPHLHDRAPPVWPPPGAASSGTGRSCCAVRRPSRPAGSARG